MSITSGFLLFLLCLSLHACSSRRLGIFYTKNTLEKKLYFPVKSDMQNGFRKNLVAVLQAKSHADDDDDTQKLEDADVNHKSVVSVSWRVPHGERCGKHPGLTWITHL